VSEIGRLAEGQLFLPGASAHLTHDDKASVDAQADSQLHAVLLGQAGIQRSHGLHHPEPSPHGPLRVILVREGIPKVDEQAITEILRDMPLKAGDHLGAGLLIGPHHLAPLFRVEPAGEHR
jgi:hypothetical protein